MAEKILRQEFIETVNISEIKTDITGIVSADHIVQTGPAVAAADIAIADIAANFAASDVENAMSELASNVSTGKGSIATSITNKGGTANGTDTFAQLASAIDAIQAGGAIETATHLGLVAPYQKTIVLVNERPIEELTTSILKIGSSSTLTTYTMNFDNGDATSFDFNSTFVEFGGTAKTKSTFTYNMNNQGVLGGGTLYESDPITVANFNEFDSLSTDITSTLTVNAAPANQVIKANSDISLAGIANLDSIASLLVKSGTGDVKLAASVDSGTTWKAWNGSSWVSFDVNDAAAFDTNGMNEATFEALTDTELETLRGASETIRFAYLLKRPTYSDTAETDQLTLDVVIAGSTDIAADSDFNVSYNAGTKTITYDIITDGSYIFNWVD